MLQNDPLRLLPLNFDADPDPAFHSDADPDPALAFHLDVNPDADLDLASQKIMRIRTSNTADRTGVKITHNTVLQNIYKFCLTSEPGETRRLYGRWSWPLQQPEQQGIHFTQIPQGSH
jgi:hypothetical protein